MTADQPPAPAYFAYDAALNRKEHQTLDAATGGALRALTLEDALRLQAAGAQVLDARDSADYAGAHLTGALNVGLGGAFASWAGQLVSRERPIVLVAEPGREREAALRLARVGLEDVAGYLDAGMAALAERPELTARTERITAPTLAERITGTEPPLLVDVRQPGERAQGHISGAVHIALGDLSSRLGELPQRYPIAVYCAGGYRSSIAASLLQRAGFSQLLELVGGITAWTASRLPVADEHKQ